MFVPDEKSIKETKEKMDKRRSKSIFGNGYKRI